MKKGVFLSLVLVLALAFSSMAFANTNNNNAAGQNVETAITAHSHEESIHAHDAAEMMEIPLCEMCGGPLTKITVKIYVNGVYIATETYWVCIPCTGGE